MSLNSPFSEMFNACMERIKTVVPEIRHVDQDMGQIEGFSARPTVAFPCILLDFTGWSFTNMGQNSQAAVGNVIVKLGFAQFSPSSDSVDAAYREEALQFYELEFKLNSAFHGWSPGDDFGYMTRTNVDRQNRNPGIRVSTMSYQLGFEDYSTKTAPIMIPKPPVQFSGENL